MLLKRVIHKIDISLAKLYFVMVFERLIENRDYSIFDRWSYFENNVNLCSSYIAFYITMRKLLRNEFYIKLFILYPFLKVFTSFVIYILLYFHYEFALALTYFHTMSFCVVPHLKPVLCKCYSIDFI